MDHNVPTFIIALIVIGYFAIAVQFYISARGSENNQGKQAMFLLLGIFILCSLAGYMPRLIGVPAHIELAIHVSLVVMTWWFVFTNQAAHIMKALR